MILAKHPFPAVALMLCMLLGMPQAFAAASPVNLLAFGDSYMRLENPDTNYGTESRIRTTHTTNTGITQYTVISFDLSTFAISNGVSELESVILQLGVPTNVSSGQTQDVYRLRRDFVETQVTWNEYSTGNAWQTPGALGPDDAVLIATGVNGGGNDLEWANGGLDVTDIANAWLANPDTDHLGFLIFSPIGAVNQIRVYGSRESTEGPGPGPVLAIVIPEPGSLLLLGAGAALMLSRRRGQQSVSV